MRRGAPKSSGSVPIAVVAGAGHLALGGAVSDSRVQKAWCSSAASTSRLCHTFLLIGVGPASISLPERQITEGRLARRPSKIVCWDVVEKYDGGHVLHASNRSRLGDRDSNPDTWDQNPVSCR